MGHFQDAFTDLYNNILVKTWTLCMPGEQLTLGFIWPKKIMVTQYQPRAMTFVLAWYNLISLISHCLISAQSSLFRPLPASCIPIHHIPAYSSTFKPVLLYVRLFQPTQAYPNIFKHIQPFSARSSISIRFQHFYILLVTIQVYLIPAYVSVFQTCTAYSHIVHPRSLHPILAYSRLLHSTIQTIQTFSTYSHIPT